MGNGWLTLLLCLLLFPGLRAQQQRRHRIVSYNVENLFDCADDTLKADDEYLPHGKRRWSMGRYRHKLGEVAKTLLALSREEGEAPLLVGLYEVENEQVVEALTRQTPLRSVGYRYIITSSADVRGIDVALLYRPDCFRLLSARTIRANLPGQRPTRDVLHVSGIVAPATGDTLDLFLLHLPSRMSGTHETEPYRCHVARAVRQAADSLCRIRRRPCLLLMGDFNEAPDGRALTNGALRSHPLPQPLRTTPLPLTASSAAEIATASNSAALTASAAGSSPTANTQLNDTTLYNLLAHRPASSLRAIKGSYKYQGHWELIDHLLATGALLRELPPYTASNPASPYTAALPAGQPTSVPRLHLLSSTAQVAPLPFLLTADRMYGGQCPLRTYYGSTYLGGPSDHLPLVVDLAY